MDPATATDAPVPMAAPATMSARSRGTCDAEASRRVLAERQGAQARRGREDQERGQRG